MKRLALILAALFMTACGPPKGTPASEILEDINFHYGKRITIRTKFFSGARCRQGEDGEWKTYCKGCQYCKGPLVVDPGVKVTDSADWPMILGGTWEYRDIRCKGPLNQVECYPFELGKTYVVRGKLEKHKPPKLLVSKFWVAD